MFRYRFLLFPSAVPPNWMLMYSLRVLSDRELTVTSEVHAVLAVVWFAKQVSAGAQFSLYRQQTGHLTLDMGSNSA